MGTAQGNGVELEYDTFGDRSDPALLLVMGLGAQMVAWRTEFCEQLAGEGFFVIRFDNRDVGLSTKLDGHPVDFGEAMGKFISGEQVDAPYRLPEMAGDGFAVLDAVGVDAAHVVGASMGGMIAQTMAITRPERVRSLTSIMSTTGDRSVGGATPEAMALLTQRPPADRAGFLDATVAGQRLLHGPVIPFDEAESRERAAEAYDRCYHPEGVGRQLIGILASGDRTAALAEVAVPTLVLHGDVDPLVDVSGGEATAKAVPGSTLHILKGMGHDLPREVWDEAVAAIAEHANTAGASAPTSTSSTA